MILAAIRRRRKERARLAEGKPPLASVPSTKKKFRINWSKFTWTYDVEVPARISYGGSAEALPLPVWAARPYYAAGDGLPILGIIRSSEEGTTTEGEIPSVDEVAIVTPRKPLIRLPKIRPAWILPSNLVPTDDMSQDELVADAQESRPLLREFGWRDSAVMHPSETNVRYLRVCSYLGKMPIRPYLIQYVTTLAMAGLMALMFSFGPEQQSEDLALGGGAFAIVGGLVGLLFGTGIGYSARTMSQFWVSHGFARIAQKVVENGIRRTVAVYELPLLRLGFANRHGERIFSGVEERSGFANGRMNLETDMELSTMVDPREFYKLGAVRPCISSFTGVSSSRRHSLNGMAKLAGRINAEKQAMRQKGDIAGWIGEHKGLTFFGISAAISFLVLMIGVDIDLSQAKEIF